MSIGKPEKWPHTMIFACISQEESSQKKEATDSDRLAISCLGEIRGRHKLPAIMAQSMMACIFETGRTSMLEIGTTVKFAFFIFLTIALNSSTVHAIPESFARASSLAALTRAGSAQVSKKKQPRKKKGARKSQKLMREAHSTAEQQPPPVLDTPNRVEIDPGDIPPTQRRNPDVDDRTKIPENIDPGDRVPPASIPKPKKPCRPQTS